MDRIDYFKEAKALTYAHATMTTPEHVRPFPRPVRPADPLDTAEETLKTICNRFIDEIENAANAHDDVALTLLEVRLSRIVKAVEAVESLAAKYATDYRLTEILNEQK